MSSVDISSMMQAFASLKKIPVEKVLRNAAKDYVQGAFEATPSAQIGKSEFYRAEKGNKRWYIHESQLAGRKIRNKKGSDVTLKKVRIKKGWMKSTWIGAMRALGMKIKDPAKRLHGSVKHKSLAVFSTGSTTSTVTIADQMHIDNFGKTSTQPQHERISSAGFTLAAKRLATEYARMIKQAWGRK